MASPAGIEPAIFP